MRAVPATISMALAMLTMHSYRGVTVPANGLAGMNLDLDGGLLFACGACVNGAHCLLTTAAATDLGKIPEFSGPSNALGVVSAVIYGSGTFGMAMALVIFPVINDYWGWAGIRWALYGSACCSVLALSRVVRTEVRRPQIASSSR